MMKKANLIFLLFCLNIVQLTAMEYKGPKPTITPDIALTVQAASQEGAIRKKIIDTFAKHSVDLARETGRDLTKLIQLGAIFLGARTESNTLKLLRLAKYENRSDYKRFFAKYPQLSDALIEFAEIKKVELSPRKGKLG